MLNTFKIFSKSNAAMHYLCLFFRIKLQEVYGSADCTERKTNRGKTHFRFIRVEIMAGDTSDTGGQGVESSLLGVTSWWLTKHNRVEVMALVTKHFRPEEMFEANKLLASVCKL